MTGKLAAALRLDVEAKAEELATALRKTVLHRLHRRGIVIAVSGGIDSACVAALAKRAIGKARVAALLLPERESSPESLLLGRKLCETLGVPYTVQEITPVLDALGCYAERDAAVRELVPEFTDGMPWKIVLASNPLASEAVHFFQLVAQLPSGERRVRLPSSVYLRILAATNSKQRTRKLLEYNHADRLAYAVAGTPNRLEYDQGFFVKLGDGAADVKPIASLYKTQVHALARHLGVIDEILDRCSTTDTYSLEQSQEDFYFSVPLAMLDRILWAKNHGWTADATAVDLGYAREQVQRVYDDIDQKRRATAYLHAGPLLLEPIDELPSL